MNAMTRFNYAERVELIGEEKLTLGRVFTLHQRDEITTGIRVAAGSRAFSPRDELHRLLSVSPSYSKEQLEEAEAAEKRLSGYVDEGLDVWAAKLGNDFSQFED